MIIKIDFNSDEAIYMQITNQIIMGIAKRRSVMEISCLPYEIWQMRSA